MAIGPRYPSLTAVLHNKATAADKQKSWQLLTRLAPQIRLTERAAALSDCDFHRDWKLGPNLMLPEYATARFLAMLLAAQADLLSEEGRPLEALRSIAFGARIGQHMARDPIMIALLVRIAIAAIMNQAFLRIIKTYAGRMSSTLLSIRSALLEIRRIICMPARAK